MASATVNDSGLGLTHFHFEVDSDGVATLLMDVQGQTMNTLSDKVSSDLRLLVEHLETNADIKAVVIGSAKKGSFIAGADIDMLSAIKTAAQAAQMSRDGQQGFTRLEEIYTKHHKPVVAAIDGPAMGGGLELALACSMRIVSDSSKTVLAVPEVKLGLLPGAGGTQRLPRLVGIAKGLDMMLTGRNIRSKKAVKMGLADEVVPAPILLDVAKTRALAAAGVKPKSVAGLARIKSFAAEMTDAENLQQMALEENPVGRMVLFKKAREQTYKTTRGNYPAAERILQAVQVGMEKGLEAGYNAEAEYFGELVVSAEARALTGIFFGTQELKKDSGVADKSVKPRPVKRLAVLGGGLMGAGVAAVSASKTSAQVRIKEVDDAGVGRGLKHVYGFLEKGRKRKIYTKHDVGRLMSRITGCTDTSGFESIDLVIEAVFEDLGLKKRLLAEVESACSAETIFATNTSSLPISDIAADAARPENVIGMHYFSPVEKMPLLEIITTDKTADWVTATCVEFGKRQGKTVIVVRDGTGFYTSRALGPYMNEAAWALSEGVPIDRLDAALVDWGFPVGPITLLDEVGIDVGAKVAGIMQAAFGNRLKAPGAMDLLLGDDRKGRKNGRGFYLYEKGKKGAVDDTVYKTLGIKPGGVDVSDEDLQLRLALQLVNEAAYCLEEDILLSPRDGDIGAIFGIGFPPYLGGPFRYVDSLGADKVVGHLDRFAERYGERFTAAQILKDYASAGKKFHS